MKKDFKIGDTVYVYENWSGEIVKAVVSKKSKNGVYINYQYFVDNNGKELNRFIGSSYRKFNEIWDSVAEALNIKKERNNKIIQEYLKEIKNIEDLVKFPINHCFCGEKYAEEEAKAAYIIRVKELLNIQINK